MSGWLHTKASTEDRSHHVTWLIIIITFVGCSVFKFIMLLTSICGSYVYTVLFVTIFSLCSQRELCLHFLCVAVFKVQASVVWRTTLSCWAGHMGGDTVKMRRLTGCSLVNIVWCKNETIKTHLNPLKCSGIRQLNFEVFSAIRV